LEKKKTPIEESEEDSGNDEEKEAVQEKRGRNMTKRDSGDGSERHMYNETGKESDEDLDPEIFSESNKKGHCDEFRD